MTAAPNAFADEFLDAVVDVARVGICIVNANGVGDTRMTSYARAHAVAVAIIDPQIDIRA